ncbi:MAG: efflux RND transporter periplasmic adaptor subunit [FCB group bacterium]|nr:efflux RND transporter periplasmic adaptor subunit [FCB group bacterium]
MKKLFSMKTILTGLVIVTGLIVAGCSSEKKADATPAQTTESTELYTCGMHPNVIQEGPGDCPICGMKLNPLNGGGTAAATTTAATNSSSGERKILYWQAPMDPSYISPKPGKSPMGMDLIPVYEGEEAFGSTVKINPVTEQNMGVRKATVERRDLTLAIRTVARVETDESLVSHINTKISGWVEKTYVSTTGERVRKGQKLIEIYSPQLVTAQDEYLDAYHNVQSLPENGDLQFKQNMKNILHSTRTRLEYFDISQDQIRELEETGMAKKTLIIRSPYDGFVITKHVLDGMEVKPGMTLYTLADLSILWIQAEIYESELPWVAEDQKATVTLPYFPGESFEGVVDYIYPVLETKSRTIKVRLVVPNPELKLKPGMYANVTIHANPVKNVVAVPQEAVLFSGERTLVFVALGGGRFAPRDVSVGIQSGDHYYEIKDGLKAGEKIVLSGQFLLDSESRLQEGIAKMLANRQAAKSTPGENENSAEQTGKTPKDKPASGMKMDMDMNMNMDQPMDMKDNRDDSRKTSASIFDSAKDGNLTFYTCPMKSHSFVKVAEPGDCPKCGMQLVKKTIKVEADAKWYTCPMPEHSYVVTEAPGECPECGMDLVEMPVAPITD